MQKLSTMLIPMLLLLLLLLLFLFLYSHAMINVNNSLQTLQGITSPTRRGTNQIKKNQFENLCQFKLLSNNQCGGAAIKRISNKPPQSMFSRSASQKLGTQINASANFYSNGTPKNFVFNYERQLQIMLDHQLKIDGLQRRLCSHNKNITYNNGQLTYNIFALKDALENEKKYAKNNCNDVQQQTESVHVLSIIGSLYESIKYLEPSEKTSNKYVNGLWMKLKDEQMRFIGLILWHFVFRENPIFDECNKRLVFFAKMTPNIDPSDTVTIGQMVNEMKKALEQRAADGGKPFVNILDKNQFLDEYARDMKLLDQLEHQRQHALANVKYMECIKNNELIRMELLTKFSLLRHFICLSNATDCGCSSSAGEQRWTTEKINNPIPLYTMIDRAFIVFGRDAPSLILLIKALLEGKMNGKQLENYLKNDKNVFNNSTINEDDQSYFIMSPQLGKILHEYS